MIEFTDVLGSPRCHSWHKMKVMWLHSCHQGNGEISEVAKIYTGVWFDLENIYYKEWKRRSEKIDFDTSSWLEMENQKYNFVSMLWTVQCQGHCYLSKHRRTSRPYGGIWDWLREFSLRVQADNALPIFMVHSYLVTFTALPKVLCSLHHAERKTRV